MHILRGKTMGTYYQIKYTGPLKAHMGAMVNKLLAELNSEVSTYIKTSVISRINQNPGEFDLTKTQAFKKRKCRYFIENYRLADSIYRLSDGDFDPTIMPLVNYWGFGYSKRERRTGTIAPDSIRRLVGMDKIALRNFVITKSVDGVQLDFSAVAKGYGVDLIGRLLEQQGIQDFLIDIGGEVLAKGEKAKGSPWLVGINTPKENSRLSDIVLTAPVRDAAIATSGNYRNYYRAGGRKYSHTINPKTGVPERNNLLSASIWAKNCALADALATTCMVKGMPEAYDFITKTKGVEGCFIYNLPSGRDTIVTTRGFEYFHSAKQKK